MFRYLLTTSTRRSSSSSSAAQLMSRCRLACSNGASVRSLSSSSSKAAALSTAADANASSYHQHGSSSEKPFDKVLIANRGEIAERVMHTCRKLGIETVAIYSTADAQSRFVTLADEAVCVGPPDASRSYLDVDKVLRAVRDTGSQAVHPGYGFLSENANFARSITDMGVVWLGPPTYAVQHMGDKLMSKIIAKDADVTTIPGLDTDEIMSVEHALEVCNGVVGYPVLLKAVAGGGGKGMRVCYDDRDIREAWGIAKSEALKFFSDDRLLIEKYIEEPHHIEFQVLCAPKEGEKVEVVVFPERECSIQRRNQKIIEETPSCLLQEATRLEMASQVERLCQAVGYESAGTVEFLVDSSPEQNFYFLEMNTRLQVEHPVSEAICNVDLVKGMLWVGAGWGFPPEYLTKDQRQNGLILPHKGHAVEARVYAEDPLRGFLPSTGPLSMYIEPNMKSNTPDNYLRMDSGVTAGHLVSPHYDPMISKVVYYSKDGRSKAIAGLSQALDEYVIEGVQHNSRLVQSVLRHPDFQMGITPTSFLPTHFPDGFVGVPLTTTEYSEFAAAAALIAQQRRHMLEQPPLEYGADDGDGHIESELINENAVIVKLGGLFGKPAFKVDLGTDSATVTNLESDESETVRFDSELVYQPEKFWAHLTLNDKRRTLQVLPESMTGEIPMQMYGHNTSVLVQSIKEHELSQFMHEPVELDTTNLVQSPMPGTLISFAVAEGDEVEDGQELCIVEAMKMQNIIRAPKHGVIKSLKVPVGSSLKNDDVILEFEKDENNGDAEE